MLRDDYLPFGNIVRVLLATICATFSAVMLGLPRILLHSGYTPCPLKRLRQREAVRGVTHSRSAICLSSSLSAANKTMRQRSTTRTGVVRHRINFCSSAFSDQSRARRAFQSINCREEDPLSIANAIWDGHPDRNNSAHTPQAKCGAKKNCKAIPADPIIDVRVS